MITGAKNREDIYKAYQNILPILKEYKKTDQKLGKDLKKLNSENGK